MSGPDQQNPPSDSLKDAFPQAPETQKTPEAAQDNAELSLDDAENAKQKIDEVVDDETANMYISFVRGTINQGESGKLISAALGLAASGNREIALDIFERTLGALSEDHEVGQDAKKALQEIQLVRKIAGEVMIEGKVDQGKLLDELSTLAESSEGAEVISNIFMLFEKSGNWDAQEYVLNMLNAIRIQPGERGQNALLALDRIGAITTSNPEVKEAVQLAIAQKVNQLSALKLSRPEPTPDATPPESEDYSDIVILDEPTPESEAEKLAKKATFDEATAELERQLDDDLKLAQEERQQAEEAYVQTGIFPEDWPPEKIFQAKQRYAAREKQKQEEQQKAERDLLARRNAERAEMSKDEAKVREFLGLGPETPTPSPPKESPSQAPAPEPEKPQVAVSAKATEAVNPTPSTPSVNRLVEETITDKQLEERLAADEKAKEQPKGGITVKKNIDDPLEGLT